MITCRPRVPAALPALLLACVAACGDDWRLQADAGSPPPPDAAVPEDAPPAADAAPPSGVGEPCDATGYFEQGDCADGLFCVTEEMTQGSLRNGYCTQECGAAGACPADSTCISVAEGRFQLCAKSCTRDEQCRADDGYRCVVDEAGQVCWPWSPPPGTIDGGACETADAGPFLDAPDRIFGASVQLVAPDWSFMEAETHVVARGSAVAAAYIAIGDTGGGAKMAVNASTNGGQSFGPAVVVDDSLTAYKSDPVLAFDPAGAHLYLTWIGYDYLGTGTTNMRVFVARSDDGGATWPAAQVKDVSGSDSGKISIDKPWITTGPGGAVYATYTTMSETTGASAIKIVRSGDDGATWDPPLRVDDGARTMSAFRNLATPATDAAGDVWVTWVELASNEQYGHVANDVYVARWDAGTTWAFGPNVRASANADLVVFNDPVVAPAPSGDTVYLVYTAGTPDVMRWDVRLTWSDDRGATFTPTSVKLNDDPTCATHFLPAAAIDGQDRLHVTWYDNRFGTDRGALYYTRWDPIAGAGGPSQLLSDGFFPFTIERTGDDWLGDYTGLAVDGTTLYATWADPRTDGTSHVRFARGTAP
jgi:hypothetical protein